MIIKILILVGLIKLLLQTDQPFVCAGIYTTALFALGLFAGHPLTVVLIAAGIALVLSSLYFWLLDKLEGNDLLWWLVAVLGIGIGLV